MVVANLLDGANSSVSRKNASVYPVLALTRVVRARELVNLRRIPRIVGKYSCPYSIWWLSYRAMNGAGESILVHKNASNKRNPN